MEIIRETEGIYLAPHMTIIAISIETPCLQASLEDISGGDDPEINW